MADEPDEYEEHGRSLLSRLSNEMVRAQKRFFGKGPTEAKSYMLDDMLIIVMRGGLTTAEKTMLEFGQPDQVRQFRQIFENEMTERLTDMVEELTGRKVATYQSQIMFDPHLVVEMFVFDSAAHEDDRTATAEGQTIDDSIGEASDEAIEGRTAGNSGGPTSRLRSRERERAPPAMPVIPRKIRCPRRTASRRACGPRSASCRAARHPAPSPAAAAGS